MIRPTLPGVRSPLADKAQGFSSLKSRLLSGGMWAFGGKVVMGVTALASNALLARLLSPEHLGSYFLAFSLVTFGAAVGTLGLNQAVVRLVAESRGMGRLGRTRHVVSLVSKLGILGSLGVGLTYLLLGDTVATKMFDAPALAAVTGLVAGWMVVITVQLLLAEIFRGFQDFRSATFFGGLVTGILLTACLMLLWLLDNQWDLTTVVLLAAGSVFVSNILAVLMLRRKTASLPARSPNDQIDFLEIVRVSWPLLITGVALFFVNQADIWVVGAFRPQEEVATYGAAFRLVMFVAVPLLIVNAVVPPMIAEMHSQGEREKLERVLRTTAALAGLPAFLTLVAFILLGGPILGLVYGDYYREGAAVLTLLSIGQLVNVWVGSCGQALMMTGNQAVMMKITLLGGLLAVGGALWAVRYYGATGVAGAVAVGLVLQNFSMLLLVKKKMGIWTHADFSSLLPQKVLRR